MSYLPEDWLNGMNGIKDDLQKLHGFVISGKNLASYILANTRYEYNSAANRHQISMRNGNIDLKDLEHDMQEHFKLY